MSVEAVSWALNAPLAGNAKIVLIGLANHADAHFEHCRPSIATLAHYAHCDERTIQRQLRLLQEEGWVEKTGEHPMGGRRNRLVNVYRLIRERGDVLPPQEARGDIDDNRGDSPVALGVTPVPPKPSIEPSIEPSSGVERAGAQPGNGPTSDPRNQIPPGFPDELRPHAREVTKILRHIAADHGAKKVWPLAVGRIVMAHPRKPLVAAAHDLAAWAVDPPRPIKDVTATYRTWLNRVPELEAIERLASDGTTTTARTATSATVTHIGTARRDKKGGITEVDAEVMRTMRLERQAQREAAQRDDQSGET